MKRILAIFIAATMLITLISCSKDKKSNNNEEKEAASSDTSDTNSNILPAGDDSTDDTLETEPSEEEDEIEPSVNGGIIKEDCDLVLYDHEGITVTAASFTEEEDASLLHLKLKNDSGKNILMLMSDIYVNGIYISGNLETAADDGETMGDELALSSAILRNSGITSINEIKLTLTLKYNDSRAEIISGEVLLTTESEEPKQELNTEGTAIIDTEETKIIVQSIDTSAEYGVGVTLCFVNNTTGDLTYYINNCTAKSCVKENALLKIIPASSVSYGSFTIYTSDIEEAGISAEDIDELSFSATIEGSSGVIASCENMIVNVK